MSSMATRGQLGHLATGDYLPPPIVAFPRSLVIMAENGDVLLEALQKPKLNEQLSIILFLIYGLGFLIHPFFCSFLHFYCLQKYHLSPNYMLHIMCLITLREAFLCVEPHFGLWSKYFSMKFKTNLDKICECSSDVNWTTLFTLALSHPSAGLPSAKSHSWSPRNNLIESQVAKTLH